MATNGTGNDDGGGVDPGGTDGAACDTPAIPEGSVVVNREDAASGIHRGSGGLAGQGPAAVSATTTHSAEASGAIAVVAESPQTETGPSAGITTVPSSTTFTLQHQQSAATSTSVSNKEEVHVKALKTVSDSWFALSRKAGTDKATLMDHYRRLFKLTLMLVEKYDSELDSTMRAHVLERMRLCHMALAPRVPSLVQIYATIEAVFATANIDVCVLPIFCLS